MRKELIDNRLTHRSSDRELVHSVMLCSLTIKTRCPNLEETRVRSIPSRSRRSVLLRLNCEGTRTMANALFYTFFQNHLCGVVFSLWFTYQN